jgi:hypothetical protein
MPVYAPTTDELRAELSERAAALEKGLRRLTKAIVACEERLLEIAEEGETAAADKIRALGVVNRSLHARLDADRRELAAARRLLQVDLPKTSTPEQFAAAVQAGQIPGIPDLDRAKLYPPRPGLDDLGDAGLRDLPDDELQAQRRAYYVKGSG